MKIKPTVKTYESDELVVKWQPSKCIHSEKCWRGLPEVFRRNEKPWVNLDGAKAKEIQYQLDSCPSGALSGFLKNTDEQSGGQNSLTEIEVTKNGPLLVKGQTKLIYTNGTSENKEKTIALCRCGASNKKPYCDGTHSRIDFKG